MGGGGHLPRRPFPRRTKKISGQGSCLRQKATTNPAREEDRGPLPPTEKRRLAFQRWGGEWSRGEMVANWEDGP